MGVACLALAAPTQVLRPTRPRPPTHPRTPTPPASTHHPTGARFHAQDHLHRRRQHRLRQEPARRHPQLSRTRRRPPSACSTSTRSGCAPPRSSRGKIADALGAQPTIEGHHRPPRGARRRRLRHQHVPGRRLQARHRDRLRDPEEVRPAPDHRRHARHRRHHARAAHHPRAARHVPRHGRAVPGRDLPAVRQPDGDELLGDQPRHARSRRSACATACRARPSSWPATSACRSRRSTTCAPASTTWRSTCEFERRRRRHRRPLPASQCRAGCVARPQRAQRRRHRRPIRRGALRDVQPARLLRHRVERALRRVRAVVHQARPARPDRAVQHPARRVHPRCESQIAGLGAAAREQLEAPGVDDRGDAAATNMARRSSTPWRPGSRAWSTATCATTA